MTTDSTSRRSITPAAIAQLQPIAVRRARLLRLSAELAKPMRTAHHRITKRDVWLVEIETDDLTGWGECGALPSPGYTHETSESAAEIISGQLLCDRGWLGSVGALRQRFFEETNLGAQHPMAYAAVEMAVLDAQLRAEQLAFQDLARSAFPDLDEPLTNLRGRIVLGLEDATDELVARAFETVADGFDDLKVKVMPEFLSGPLSELRQALPHARIGADANGSLTGADRPEIESLANLRLSMLEQPLAAGQLVAMADIAAATDIAVVLDESVASLDQCRAALEIAPWTLNIKAPKFGGYVNALEAACFSSPRQGRCFVGGMYDSGVGRTANLRLSSLSCFSLAPDLGPSERYFTNDVTDPVLAEAGVFYVPSTPGLSGAPKQSAVAEAEVAHEL